MGKVSLAAMLAREITSSAIIHISHHHLLCWAAKKPQKYREKKI